MFDFDRMYGVAQSTFLLPSPTDHGIDHWKRVERNFLHIADAMGFGELERAAGRLFAIFHDCRRVSEFRDPRHGESAWAFLRRQEFMGFVRRKLGERLYVRLGIAIAEHNHGKISETPFVGACWDADRMDLPRVGIIPNLSLMSTEFGKRFAIEFQTKSEN